MNANRDLQATHQILSLLERSKSSVEEIVEQLPDIFAIIDDSGRIVKCNLQAARVLNVEMDDALSVNLAHVFREHAWAIFKTYLQEVMDDPSPFKTAEFELGISDASGDRIFYWSLRKVPRAARYPGFLFSVSGRDITQLRAYEKHLSEIFSSIPLGILTVGKDGQIEMASRFSTWLLDTPQVSGAPLFEVLFKPAWDRLKPGEREGVKNILQFASFPIDAFDLMSSSFPGLVLFDRLSVGDQRWIGLKYQPIAFGSEISKLLVILEDRTDLIKAEEEKRKKSVLEDQHIQRIIQLKSADQTLLPDMVEESNMLFDQVQDCMKSGDRRTLVNSLHGIKGIARVGGFENLKNMTHAIESDILEHSEMSVQELKLGPKIEEIRAEWNEYKKLFKVLILGQGDEAAPSRESIRQAESSQALVSMIQEYRSQASQGLTVESYILGERIMLAGDMMKQREMKELEEAIVNRAKETAGAVGKDLDVQFNWKDIRVTNEWFDVLRTGLFHIINNGIDHGIESPEERVAAGKPAAGLLRISGFDLDGWRLIQIEDDGRGINVEKLTTAAIKKRTITIEEAAVLTPHEAMQLVFKSGVSTASEVTDISGRGVGLDAVADSVRKLGGSIEVVSRAAGGTCFRISFKLSRQWKVEPKCHSVARFCATFANYLAVMARQEGVEIDVRYDARELNKGVFYADLLRLSVAVMETVSRELKGGSATLLLERDGDKIGIRVTDVKKGDVEKSFSDKSEALYPACFEYFRQHGCHLEPGQPLDSFLVGYFISSEFVSVRIFEHESLGAAAGPLAGQKQRAIAELALVLTRLEIRHDFFEGEPTEADLSEAVCVMLAPSDRETNIPRIDVSWTNTKIEAAILTTIEKYISTSVAEVEG